MLALADGLRGGEEIGLIERAAADGLLVKAVDLSDPDDLRR